MISLFILSQSKFVFWLHFRKYERKKKNSCLIRAAKQSTLHEYSPFTLDSEKHKILILIASYLK